MPTKRPPAAAPPAAPFHNPFAVLGTARPSAGAAVPTSSDAAAPATAPAPPTGAPRVPATGARAVSPGPEMRVPRAVIRFERAGRGGKAVTVVEHLSLDAAALGEWLKALKASLGCGGTVEGGAIVLQGDHRTRLPAQLAARGVRKVTVG